eukprot:CAMPEP_0184026406 /NCGR_PEP_ID=MMETSP0954-20121128/13485_1 /TAXON_ID=627963 /ORGANISM="Aplanochytrium sp, Strain PBS07" /LENGTH=219 /DNA_ID=CAMNT_0026310571 /DNA_START=188 /DNA_END=850 /DNA_ORIENTATION=-
MHRDIKDENILITNNLVAKLSDFDMAIDFLNEDGSRKELRSGDHPFGTYYTTPPEAYIPNSPYTETADTYSLDLYVDFRYNTIAWELGSENYIIYGVNIYTVKEELLTVVGVLKSRKTGISLAARLVPRATLTGESALLEFDPYPWTESRILFSEFAKKCMKWNIQDRLTVKEACDDLFMNDVISRWDFDYRTQAQKLKQMIQDYAKLDLPLEQKKKLF